MNRWSWCFLLAAWSLAATADTIEFWRAEPAARATVIRIHEGILYYEVGGVQRNARLVDVKTIVRDAEQQISPNRAALLTLRDFTFDMRSGKLLGVAVMTELDRMYEPLVRLYTMEQDAQGRRQVSMYQNHRSVRDPSKVTDIPTVPGDSYRQKYFFANSQGAVAARLEIWLEGELILAQNATDADVPRLWWRTVDQPRFSLLRPVPMEAIEEKPKEVDAADRPPPIAVTISRAVVAPVLGEAHEGSFNVEYRLQSDRIDRYALPRVSIFLVLEDRDTRRTVRTLTGEPEAGREVNVGKGILREFTVNLPDNVATTTASLPFSKTATQALVYWRVQVTYDEHIMAVKESGDAKVRRTLAEDWWK